MSLKVLQPAGWPTPKGYANGMEGRGRHVVVGGMIGWDSHGHFAPGFVEVSVGNSVRRLARKFQLR